MPAGRPRSHTHPDPVVLRATRVPRSIDDRISALMRVHTQSRTAVTLLLIQTGLEHFQRQHEERESARVRAPYRVRKMGQGRRK